MSFDSLWFSIKSALRNVFKNAFLSIASITVLSVCLISLGCTLLVVGNITECINSIGDKNQIVVYLDLDKHMNENWGNYLSENFPESERKEMGEEDAEAKEIALNKQFVQEFANDAKSQIEKIPNITDIQYESREQALLHYQEILGTTELTEWLSDETFRPSFIFRIKDLSKYEQTIYELEDIDQIGYFSATEQAGQRAIRSSKDTIEGIVKISDIISFLSIWVIALFLIVSIFIIMNAVKLSVFSRRTEINIMKYVGATDFYIQLPYFIEGLIIGLLSGVIAFVVQVYIYNSILSPLLADLNLFVPLPLSAFNYLLWVFLGAGALVGIVGSVGPVKKYLKV